MSQQLSLLRPALQHPEPAGVIDHRLLELSRMEFVGPDELRLREALDDALDARSCSLPGFSSSFVVSSLSPTERRYIADRIEVRITSHETACLRATMPADGKAHKLARRIISAAYGAYAPSKIPLHSEAMIENAVAFVRDIRPSCWIIIEEAQWSANQKIDQQREMARLIGTLTRTAGVSVILIGSHQIESWVRDCAALDFPKRFRIQPITDIAELKRAMEGCLKHLEFSNVHCLLDDDILHAISLAIRGERAALHRLVLDMARIAYRESADELCMPHLYEAFELGHNGDNPFAEPKDAA